MPVPTDLQSVLLPRPRQVDRGTGTFVLASGTPVQFRAATDGETAFAATGLVDALRDHLGVELPLRPTEHPVATGAISLILAGRDDAAYPPDHFGWSSDPAQGEQGYQVRVTPDGVTVAASGEPGLFYGVQTLIQIAKASGRSWPVVTVTDWPVLPVRGLMLDISRMKVPRLDTLERMVETLAHFKYNQFQLYTEHTFDFARHPGIGAGASPVTPADIVALDQVCRANHIDLVPNLQSMGHHRTMLNQPRYAHLAETDWLWSVATGNEETFTLFDELYGDMIPAFSSGWFNIDADEPWDHGRGQSSALTEQGGVGRVYLQHIQRLNDLVKKHGRQTMMWADVIKYHPELADELPDNILLLDWWYEPKDRYDSVDRLKETNRRFYVCPGTSSWIALYPRLENAVKNIEGFVRDGIEAGAEGMLMTDWGDGGHYQQLSHSWYPYLWAAECAWGGSETTHEAFQPALGLQFYGDASGELVPALYRLGTAMTNDLSWNATWNTAMALWEEPLNGPVREAAGTDVTAAALAAAVAVAPYLGQIADAGIRHDLAFTLYQIAFAVEKVETTRAIRDLLPRLVAGGPDPASLAEMDRLVAALGTQRDALPGMIREFTERWMAQARRSEIRVNLDRYRGLQDRYDAAIAWLGTQREAYASGSAADHVLATYDDTGYAVLWQESRQNIQRLIEVIGFDNLPADIKSWVGRIHLDGETADATQAGTAA
ncbi:MAG: family 20 glycosylhydrolase [Chloroflexota bacterium]|nr:family 20 glycosylhydrolase [Chloroflexota bacterium]